MKPFRSHLLAACLAVWAWAACAASPPTTIAQRFAELRKSPPELYAFLLAMPKGADLHLHLTGAVYAETYLRMAAEEGLCVDLRTDALVAPRVAPTTVVAGKSRCGENAAEAARAQTDNNLAGAVIDSLSMRNFVPGRESAHDHFFGTFGKFGPNRAEHSGDLLAEVIRRAAAQNESYLEVMALTGTPANALAVQAGFNGDFSETSFGESRDKLMAAGLPGIVAELRARVARIEKDRIAALGCAPQPDAPACHVEVRYLYQILRESPPEQVFAQVLAGFLLASEDARVVGVNIVQPEDGLVSMRDYHLQMRMIEYAKSLYPKVHLSLHAGEISPGLVPPEGLRFHVREAVELAHAERIGHGASVMYETDAPRLLETMKQGRVLVEINLTSNDLSLGVRGKDHPLPVYLKHGVPVALSTDDEGVSRTHLTEEYQRAVLDYGLGYADVKEMVRNSLEYSFLPGSSLRQAGPCGAGIKTQACREFLKANPKARLQADLEDRFAEFERRH